jgi:hypothetical protein
MRRRAIANVAALTSVSLLITIAGHCVNVVVVSPYLGVSPMDALFLEGIGSLLVGALLLLGRGGLNYWSVKAAILAAAAAAVTGAETVGPREMLRKDSWKASGFLRLGVVLLLTGVLMLAGYFLTL